MRIENLLYKGYFFLDLANAAFLSANAAAASDLSLLEAVPFAKVRAAFAIPGGVFLAINNSLVKVNNKYIERCLGFFIIYSWSIG
jgi:hypothetical protein